MFAKEVCSVSSLLEIAFVFLRLLIRWLLLHLSQIAFLPLEALVLVTVEYLLASWLWGLRGGSSSLRLQQIGILRFYIIGMHELLLRLSHVTFFLLLMHLVFFSISQLNAVIRFLLLLIVVQNFAIFDITWSRRILLTRLSIEELRVNVGLSREWVCLVLLPFIDKLRCEHLDLIGTRVVRLHLINRFLCRHEDNRLLNVFHSFTDTFILSFFLRHFWNRWVGFWTCSSCELILPTLKKERSSCLMTLHDWKSLHRGGFLIERTRILMLLHVSFLAKA